MGIIPPPPAVPDDDDELDALFIPPAPALPLEEDEASPPAPPVFDAFDELEQPMTNSPRSNTCRMAIFSSLAHAPNRHDGTIRCSRQWSFLSVVTDKNERR
jgi:hypothetical protein